MSNGAWENRNIQSGAVLWLRHSFARAFSSDSVLFPLPCGGGKVVGCHVEAKPKHLVIASEPIGRARQSTGKESQHVRLLRSRSQRPKQNVIAPNTAHKAPKRDFAHQIHNFMEFLGFSR